MRRREASYFLHEEAVFLMEYQFARVEKRCGFSNQDIKCLDSYGEVENEFIFYWLLSQKDYLMAKVGVTGIGAGKFDLDFLQKLMIPIPSERERKVSLDSQIASAKKLDVMQR